MRARCAHNDALQLMRPALEAGETLLAARVVAVRDMLLEELPSMYA